MTVIHDEDAPSAQGFRSTLHCSWVPDEERGFGLRAQWSVSLELYPPDEPTED